MREEVFKSYARQLKPILDDCVVTKSVAESDPEKYELYKMYHRTSQGSALGYDREKVKKHADALRKIFTEIPRKKQRNLSVVLFIDLINEKSLHERNAKALKAQMNAAEIFLAMSEEVGICTPPSHDKSGKLFYCIMEEKIPTNYKEEPSINEK